MPFASGIICQVKPTRVEIGGPATIRIKNPIDLYRSVQQNFAVKQTKKQIVHKHATMLLELDNHVFDRNYG